MDENWQLMLTLAVVAVAAGYLCRRGWRVLRRKGSSCGSACGGCGAAETREKELVALSVPEDESVAQRR